MATMKSLMVVVGAKTEGFQKGIEKSAATLKSFEKRVECTQKLAKGLIAGFAAVSAAAVGLGIKSVQLAGKVEQTEVAFTTMLGSAEKAQEMLKGLQQFAATTPFQFEGISDAAKKLIAFGISAEETIPTLKRIGDISAGIGAPIGEIAELYGKARVQGRLFAEDINQLTGRGIPIIQELAKQFGVAESEVKKLVESGQVNFKNLEQAFISLTSEGGKFAGLMEAQSQTILGLWSTLKDNITLSLTTIGQIITDTFDLRPKMQGAIEWLSNLQIKLVEIRDTIEKHGVRAAIERFISPQTQAIIVGVTGAIMGLATAILVALLPTLKATALAWWATLKPMIPYIALGTAIALLAYTIYKNWKQMGFFFKSIWDVITSSAELGAAHTAKAWNNLKLVVYGVIQSILDAVAPLLQWLPGAMGEGFRKLRDSVTSKLNDVKSNIENLDNKIAASKIKTEMAMKGMSAAWDGLKGSVIATFSPVVEATKKVNMLADAQNSLSSKIAKTTDAIKKQKEALDSINESAKVFAAITESQIVTKSGYVINRSSIKKASELFREANKDYIERIARERNVDLGVAEAMARAERSQGWQNALKKAGVPSMDTGGIVPGPIGAPRLILAHGGETVLPTHKGTMPIDYDRFAQAIAKHIKPSITMNTTINSPEPVTPSVAKRKQEQLLRQLAMEWGV